MKDLILVESKTARQQMIVDNVPVMSKGLGVVYVVKNDIGNVKIGRTMQPKIRLTSIEKTSGIKITDLFLSTPCSNYIDLELIVLNRFSEGRMIGEWFSVPFEDVCDFVKTLEFNTIPKQEKECDINSVFDSLYPEEKYEYHCVHCLCPKSEWKPSLKTYHGNECMLYEDFLEVIYTFENIESFDLKDIIHSCKKSFGSEYPDITNFEITIGELVDIVVDSGIMPSGYQYAEIESKIDGLALVTAGDK